MDKRCLTIIFHLGKKSSKTFWPAHKKYKQSDVISYQILMVLFLRPYYDAIFVDQSIALNRRQDDTTKIKTEDIELEAEDDNSCSIYETIQPVNKPVAANKLEISSICGKTSLTSRSLGSNGEDVIFSSDNITRIYACATMWHETATEMVCMLKSIFRLDEDQCARRNAQRYLKIVDPDYYELEVHILFDDAFEINEFGEPMVNGFFKQFLNVINVAASAVHKTAVYVKAPKKISTPYGGRFVWILPGKNKLIVHLKDKTKIRHRKRWSQVMYMYYLLGHRLMEKVDGLKRKAAIAERTFILTLDGDVDFRPSAVRLLVDLMVKNRRLGAACGRIHPRGRGPMIWYQKFEYAIGHWFQKAAEHMIGCVLCAPGCFSLFRATALIDDNVLRKYAIEADRAIENVQYDQGEDRWLCTLLLQRGYRVEYCAASDALTFAPETFDEFFNQRRRWIPSTLANIIDLLSNSKPLVSANDSISVWDFYR
uniref:chitin synthase n=1 Tax=Romanomermis culicivorax TaxID=13658 RepID=A0A915I2J5_ROMCU